MNDGPELALRAAAVHPDAPVPTACLDSRRVEGWLAGYDAAEGRLSLFDGDLMLNFSVAHPERAALARVSRGSAVALAIQEGQVAAVEIISPGRVADVAGDEAEMRYRYLAMRDPEFRRRLDLRHDLWLGISNLLAERGFRYVETPLLASPSASGAREYLTRSTRSGREYALSQSPQIYGHLLAIGGLKRYFQWSRCFRDEDLRSNRQPEFTQLHLEMAFSNRESIIAQVEEVMRRAFQIAQRNWPQVLRLTHAEAMSRFGTDKPDFRIAPQCRSLPLRIAGEEHHLFAMLLPQGMVIDHELRAAMGEAAIRRQLRLVGSCKQSQLESAPLPMTLDTADLARFADATGNDAATHDCFLVSGEWKRHSRLSRDLYSALATRDRRPAGDSLLWVTSFPLFEADADNKGRLRAACHPFLQPEDVDAFLAATRNSELLAMRGEAMDLVLNGEEIGSGSMLISDRAVQERTFRALGLARGAIRRDYGTLVQALRFGAPPIGGFGLGFDRLVASLSGCAHIRDVMAFPKSKTGSCMVFGDATDSTG